MTPERLKKIRKEKGVSQSDVAEILGISRQAYNHYETGRRDPSNESLNTLANYFSVSVDYLLGRTPAPNVTEPEQRIEAYDLMPGYGYSDLDDEDKEFVEAQMKHMVEQLLKKKGKK